MIPAFYDHPTDPFELALMMQRMDLNKPEPLPGIE